MKLTVTWDTSKELPVPTNDELELVAGLAIQEMYSRFGEKGRRFLREGGYIFCAWQIGYKITEEQFPLFPLRRQVEAHNPVPRNRVSSPLVGY